MKEEHEQIPFVRYLCKGDTEEEIREAEANFKRFLSVLARMADRLEDVRMLDDT